MEDKVKDFVHEHGIRIIDANKRAHRITKLNYEFFQNSRDFNEISHYPIFYDTEPLYTVEIAESELERIAEFEARVFNNLREHGNYNLFEVLMEQKHRENYLKDKFPAVKKAYEQYSLMLKLAESGEL